MYRLPHFLPKRGLFHIFLAKLFLNCWDLTLWVLLECPIKVNLGLKFLKDNLKDTTCFTKIQLF